MDRRTFISRVEALGLGFFCGAGSLLGGCAESRFVMARQDGQQLVVSKAEVVGRGDFLVERPGHARPIYVFHRGGDDYVAVWTRCTHRGCQVAPAGERLVCPCHGSEYTREGRVVQGPAVHDLQRFSVTADEQYIYITHER